MSRPGCIDSFTETASTRRRAEPRKTSHSVMSENIAIFSGRKAWFSRSVPSEVRGLWLKRGGLVRSSLSAQYLFSDDPLAKDTIGFYKSHSRLIIFTSQWIKDAVESGRLCEIAYARYILGEPSAEASADMDAWNFADESNLKINRSLKDVGKSQAEHKCPQKPPVSKMPTQAYDGFLHIDDISLIKPAADLRDFVPNSNGFRVRLLK